MANLLGRLLPRSVKAGLDRRIARVAALRLGSNWILGRMHIPFTTRERGRAISDPIDLTSSGEGADGLPLPPTRLTMSYLRRGPDHYLDSGRRFSDALRGVMREHGVTLGPGDALLDWGCSSGRVLRHFAPEAEAGVACWGVDLAAEAVAWARDALPAFRFCTSTVHPHLPFPDATFSFIYGFSVFTHAEHLEDMWLLELNRVMKPGGVLVTTIHDERYIDIVKEKGVMGWWPESVSPDEIFDGRERTILFGKAPDDTYVFHSRAYARRVWGQYFDVLDITPVPEGDWQSAVIARKR